MQVKAINRLVNYLIPILPYIPFDYSIFLWVKYELLQTGEKEYGSKSFVMLGKLILLCLLISMQKLHLKSSTSSVHKYRFYLFIIFFSKNQKNNMNI